MCAVVRSDWCWYGGSGHSGAHYTAGKPFRSMPKICLPFKEVCVSGWGEILQVKRKEPTTQRTCEQIFQFRILSKVALCALRGGFDCSKKEKKRTGDIRVAFRLRRNKVTCRCSASTGITVLGYHGATVGVRVAAKYYCTSGPHGVSLLCCATKSRKLTWSECGISRRTCSGASR